MRATLERTTS